MRRRVVAALLLATALGIQVGLVAPARRQRDEARGEFARVREERERLRARANRLGRRAPVTVAAPSGDAEAIRSLRRSLLRATEGLPVGAVRISAEKGGRDAVAARGRLSAEGDQADLLRAAGRLAEPSSGLLLERVQLRAGRDGEVRLDVEAFSVRAPAEVQAGSRGQAGS